MSILQRTTELLDTAHARLASVTSSDSLAPAMAVLVESLQRIKDDATIEEWSLACKLCLRHPLRATLHQDPLTARAFFKPRGYAGDAGIIDLIYRHPWTIPLLAETTPLGRLLYEFLSTRGPVPRAIRARMRLAGQAIDACAARVALPHILSVACGHLREIEVSAAAARGRLGRLVALDQDEASLAEIAARHPALGIELVRESIETLLDDSSSLEGTFDLVYSTGLYDYLDARLGVRLTARLFDRLRPGGRLLVANLLRGGREVAYTESFMDWHIIYRDEDELRELALGIPSARVAAVRILDEPEGRVAFVEIERTQD